MTMTVSKLIRTLNQNRPHSAFKCGKAAPEVEGFGAFRFGSPAPLLINETASLWVDGGLREM